MTHPTSEAPPGRLRSFGPLLAALAATALGLVGLSSVLAATAPADDSAQAYVVPPDRHRVARQLLADVDVAALRDEGLAFGRPRLERHGVIFELRSEAGTRVGRLEVRPRAAAERGDHVGSTMAVRVLQEAAGGPIEEALAQGANSIVARDEGTLFVLARDGLEDPGAVAIAAGRQQLLQSLLWLLPLAVLALARLAIGRPARPGLAARFQATHILPVALQVTLFGYWGLWWSGVAAYVPIILLQLGWAYLVDGLLATARHRRWVVTFGPIPVVLSTNLFVWFAGVHLATGFGVIALAIASKALIRRGGRHVFNPSAFGIAVLGTLALVWPEVWRYRDIANELAMGPNMSELIVIVALVAQLRVPIVLTTLGAFAVLHLCVAGGFVSVLNPDWAPVLLVLTLLATDPATLPRTGLGRLLAGLVLGLGIALTGRALIDAGHSDFFAKILPVVAMNALVPWCDQLARAAPSWLQGRFAPRWNRLHVVGWLLLAIVAIAQGKAFDERLHVLYGTPGVVAAPGQTPTCADNPAWCTPFSFLEEPGILLRGRAHEAP